MYFQQSRWRYGDEEGNNILQWHIFAFLLHAMRKHCPLSRVFWEHPFLLSDIFLAIFQVNSCSSSIEKHKCHAPYAFFDILFVWNKIKCFCKGCHDYQIWFARPFYLRGWGSYYNMKISVIWWHVKLVPTRTFYLNTSTLPVSVLYPLISGW